MTKYDHEEAKNLLINRPGAGDPDKVAKDLEMIMKAAGITDLGSLNVNKPEPLPPEELAAHGLPDTEFGQALGRKIKAAAPFYKEYVTSDHNHEHVARITEATALAMLELSPYRPFLSHYMVGTDEGPAKYLMNKGAVRLSVAPEHAELGCWTEEELETVPSRYDDRSDLWVYNHDGRHWLTRPRREK